MSRIVPGAVLGVSFLALREPERAAPENIVLLCEKARCFYNSHRDSVLRRRTCIALAETGFWPGTNFQHTASR